MESTRYCMGCMHELDWDGRCHYCGFDEEKYQIDQQLSLHTQLKNGEYVLGRQIGQGGFGITYIGMDTTLLQTVAIKEYFPFGAAKRKDNREIELYSESYRDDFEAGLHAFLREGRILARFSDLPAVVGAKKFFHENNTAYLVMEYVEGISVREHVRRYGILSPTQVLAMVQPVIADMQAIHHKQVLHRDISADNLIIMHNGKLRLIDFGATRQEFAKKHYTGTILCKQGYSAIEQYSTGRNQGPWTDIYGLCASIYFMLTGIVPDSAPDRIQNDHVKDLAEMSELDMPRRQKAAIMKGLAVEAEQRYRTMADLYYALYDEKIEETSIYSRSDQESSYPAKEENGRKEALKNPRSISPTRMRRALDQLEEDRKGNKKKRTGLLAAVLLACVILSVGIGQHLLSKDMHRKQQDQTNDKSITASPDSANADKKDRVSTTDQDGAENSSDAKENGSTGTKSANDTQAKDQDATAATDREKKSASTKGTTDQSKKSASTKSTTAQSKKSTSAKSTTAQSKKSASTKSTTAQSKKSASTKNTTDQSKKSASTKSTTAQSKKSASTKSTTAQSKKSASTKSTTDQSKKSTSTKKKVNKKANSLENVEKSTKKDSNVAGDLGE